MLDTTTNSVPEIETDNTENVIDFATVSARITANLQGETIIAPAIRLNNGKIISVTPPALYSTVEKYVILDGPHGFIYADQYGFTTSAGRFVRRQRALDIATEAGQRPKKLHDAGIGLSPEDLWPEPARATLKPSTTPEGPPGPRYA